MLNVTSHAIREKIIIGGYAQHHCFWIWTAS